MSNRRRGFTLIELLIVIAIIAVLAAILFPVFSQVREKARSMACLSNMKQIGIGVQMYVQDQDERLFFRAGTKATVTRANVAVAKTDPVYNSLQWWNEIMPYLKSSAVFSCPSDPGPSASPDANGVARIPRSYVATSAAEDLTLSQVENPVETIVITEKWDKIGAGTVNNETWLEAFDGDMAPDPVMPSRPMWKIANRHAGGMNCAFYDGHAKWLRPAMISNSPDLSGCALIHRYPTPQMCDATDAGCTNTNPYPANLCNNPAFYPYSGN